jgi:outer membrane lipoprotein-sorting protein
MKKLFALLTIAGMLFFFGCGQAQQEAAEEVEATEEVVEEAVEDVEEVVEEDVAEAEEVID